MVTVALSLHYRKYLNPAATGSVPSKLFVVHDGKAAVGSDQ